jgi:hypothetical protein
VLALDKEAPACRSGRGFRKTENCFVIDVSAIGGEGWRRRANNYARRWRSCKKDRRFTLPDTLKGRERRVNGRRIGFAERGWCAV